MVEDKEFNIEDYIKSEDFYNFIYNDCCNVVHTSKIINIPNYNEEVYRYVVNFLFHYNLAYVTLKHFVLRENVSREDLEDAYQTELLNLKENTDEYIYQNTLEKFQDVKTSNKEEDKLNNDIVKEEIKSEKVSDKVNETQKVTSKSISKARKNSSRGNSGGHISTHSNRLPRIGYGYPRIYKPVPKNDHRIESFCDIRYGKIRVDNDDVASSEKGETRKLKK